MLLKKLFWQDGLAAFLIAAGFLLNLAGMGVLRWQIGLAETNLVLHYNVFFGIDLFQEQYTDIFQPSLMALVIWFMNMILGSIFYAQVLLDQQQETPEKNLKRKNKPQEKGYYLDYFDAKKLASYLLWSTGLLLQVILGVYIFAIIMVNR